MEDFITCSNGVVLALKKIKKKQFPGDTGRIYGSVRSVGYVVFVFKLLFSFYREIQKLTFKIM